MFEMIKNAFKEAKRLMDKRLEVEAEVKKEVIATCKEAVKAVMNNRQNRVTVGMIVTGVGVGVAIVGGTLIASAYIHVPA